MLLTRVQWLASRRWSSALTAPELAEQLSARWVQQGQAIAARKSAGLSGQMIALVVADPVTGDFTETARGFVMPPAFAMHRRMAVAASLLS